MASVIREVVVEAGASECWDAVRDFGELHERLVPGFVVETALVGPREREITFFNGAVATEFLVGIDDGTKRLAYSVVKGGLGSTHHNASVQVVPDGDGHGRCRIVWITDVLPDELAEPVGDLMNRGIDVIQTTLRARADMMKPE